jgi:hypothetical protein
MGKTSSSCPRRAGYGKGSREEVLDRGAEEIRKVIKDFQENPQDWELISQVEKPALGKKYNVSETETKKRNEQIGLKLLSSLEHSILGTTLNGWEPVNALYQDALNEFEDVTFRSVIEALAKLFNKGYVESQISNRSVHKLTTKELLEYYGGDLSEDEIDIYPRVVVHEFRATPKGYEEEAKDIYDAYYVSREE